MTADDPVGGAVAPGGRVRVVLRYIEVLDSKDLDLTGEFRFRFRVGVPERDDIAETRIPDDPDAHLSIAVHPARNRVTFDVVLYEGPVGPGESVVVEAEGEEVDRFSPNDPLTPYRRVFARPLADGVGEHGPWDEGGAYRGDPERLGDWQFAYAIERVDEDRI